MTAPETILINVQAPLFTFEGRLYADDQACNGLKRWAENFDHLTALFLVMEGPPPQNYLPLEEEIAAYADKIRIEPLPMAYRPDQFLRHLPGTRRKIAQLIAEARYLNFAIGACLFGDWGAVACREAHRLGRPYSVWTDRVESQVVRAGIGKGSWSKSLQARLYHRPMAALEKTAIRRAALGLFHGRETYDTYVPYCRAPHLVHNIHIAQSDHVSTEALKAKQNACAEGPLKIIYVGRIDPMKGPHDWIAVLEAMHTRGIDFQAVWLGSGTEEEALRARVRDTGLQDRVHLPGFAADRSDVLEALRTAHVMLFCHKTPESPRCLIEALISGSPIVGYDSGYPRDLTAAHGGGHLTPLHDIDALTDALAGLAQDRAQLAHLMGQATLAGAGFDDVTIFRHRADLIKSHLGSSA